MPEPGTGASHVTFTHAAVKHADLIYDVGMHRGEDTDFYLRKGFRVVAFEADPELVAINRARFSEALAASRLVIVEGAIVDGSSPEKVDFYKSIGNSEWGTIDAGWARRNENLGVPSTVIPVDAVDFSACLAAHGIPHYLKIDIEGADLVCLRRLALFENRPDYVSLESDKTSLARIREEIALLEGLGYGEFMAVQQENVRSQQVPEPAREGRYVPHRFPGCSSGLFGSELPGRWKSRAQILRQYRRILLEYRCFGDDSFWQTVGVAQRLLRRISSLLGRPIPGWYDTHARLTSARG